MCVCAEKKVLLLPAQSVHLVAILSEQTILDQFCIFCYKQIYRETDVDCQL